jgi:hypothetical protein
VPGIETSARLRQCLGDRYRRQRRRSAGGMSAGERVEPARCWSFLRNVRTLTADGLRGVAGERLVVCSVHLVPSHQLRGLVAGGTDMRSQRQRHPDRDRDRRPGHARAIGHRLYQPGGVACEAKRDGGAERGAV